MVQQDGCPTGPLSHPGAALHSLGAPWCCCASQAHCKQLTQTGMMQVPQQDKGTWGGVLASTLVFHFSCMRSTKLSQSSGNTMRRYSAVVISYPDIASLRFVVSPILGSMPVCRLICSHASRIQAQGGHVAAVRRHEGPSPGCGHPSLSRFMPGQARTHTHAQTCMQAQA